MGDEPNVKVKVPKSKYLKEPIKGIDSYKQQDGGHGS